ncbi:HAMP domain-containing sensor histidine kinase [Brevibacterium aurantiacum]|uniref:histidine kinase n=1 Tax=Brevibacterium aurantiacum TaxID=273384 RepID=A0A556C2X5_BREAU|nr:HAMP domain-containing sensor histidine kinase [Brevibacterium aurantiacum]TSI11730.1 HAMP domain-containing histidine kinase [Brevibacterium aurantiacum]
MSRHETAWRRGLRRVLGALMMGGLRARFVVVFVLVAVLGASAAAWASTQQAARSLAGFSQQQHGQNLVDQVSSAAPAVGYPPSEEDLEQLRDSAGDNALAVYEGASSSSGVFAGSQALGVTSAEMREAVGQAAGEGRAYTEQVVVDGAPWLVVGTPVMVTDPAGGRAASGVEVYAAQDLSGVEEELAGLTRSSVTTSALVLPVAVVLALLAAHTVLAPVRKLSTTARKLADGDLEARTEPRGVDELAALARTVDEMAESLQDSMVSMARMQEDAKRFAADVSHELRTPLTTLTAAVEILGDTLQLREETGQETADESDARESARLAITETRRLVQMVEDIMEIARFDSRTAPMHRENTDLASLMSSCIRVRGWSDDVEVLTQDAGQPYSVVADRRRLDVVVANLIGNGLKHGGAPVRVKLFSHADHMAVEVTDSGPGVPPEQLGKLFGRFYKADASRARSAGSGLGLAIALENAELHGGDITVENAPEGGARFTLWLPKQHEDPTCTGGAA